MFWVGWLFIVPMGVLCMLNYLRALPRALWTLRQDKVIHNGPRYYGNRPVFENARLTFLVCGIMFIVTYAFQKHQNEALVHRGVANWWFLAGRLSAAKVYFCVAAAVLMTSLSLFVRKFFYNVLFLRGFFKGDALRLKLHSTDGCGGLAPLGRFAMSGVWVIFMVGAAVVASMVGRQAYGDLPFLTLQNLLTAGLYVVLAPLAFFYPVLCVRCAVLRKTRELLAAIEAEQEEIMGDENRAVPLTPDIRRYQFLCAKRVLVQAISAWPFGRGVKGLFASQYVLMIISMAAAEVLRRVNRGFAG